MCQAIITMKIAKMCAIMEKVNKLERLCRLFMSILYKMHKSVPHFLLRIEN